MKIVNTGPTLGLHMSGVEGGYLWERASICSGQARVHWLRHRAGLSVCGECSFLPWLARRRSANLSLHFQAPSPSGSSGRPWCYVEPQASALPRQDSSRGRVCWLVCKVVGSGVDSWGYCGATDWGVLPCLSFDEFLHCSLLSSARMASR